jgi:regulator of replication initiation timing
MGNRRTHLNALNFKTKTFNFYQLFSKTIMNHTKIEVSSENIEDLEHIFKYLRNENEKLKTENELLKNQIAGKIYDV